MFTKFFKESICKIADITFLRSEEATLSYSEVDAITDNLASHFESLGVENGDAVLVSFSRSIMQYLAMISLFKLNAIYVPVDPLVDDFKIRFQNVAKSSLAYVTEQKRKIYLLPDGSIDFSFCKISFSILTYPDLKKLNTTPDAEQGIREFDGDSPGYIIYSSGTTHDQIGMVLPLSGLVYWYRVLLSTDFRGESPVNIGAITSWNFDPHIWEMLKAMAFNGSLIIANNDEYHGIDKLLEYIDHNNITHITTTPSRLKSFIHRKIPECLKCVFSTGEAFSRDVFDF